MKKLDGDRGSGIGDRGIGKEGLGTREWGLGSKLVRLACFRHSKITNNNPDPRSPIPDPHSLLPMFFLLLLLSCAGAPRASVQGEGYELSLLPAGGRAYIWVDMTEGRPLLEGLFFIDLSDRNTAQIIDSTGAAAAVIFPEGQGRRFFLAATGSFPRSKANFSLTFNRDWKRQKSASGNSFWFSQRDNIALSLESNLALVSDVDPFDFYQAEVPPEGFVEFRRSQALAGWLPSPGYAINNFIESLGIPLQIPAEEFFFGAARPPAEMAQGDNNLPSNELWELAFRIRTPSASQARSLLVLFSMARLFVQRGAFAESAGDGPIGIQQLTALLFANSPEQDGEFLNLRTGPIDERGIALLFAMFQVNSN